MDKICKIINEQFSWEVDGESIPFQLYHNAVYFEKHYSGLGYKIKWIDKSK